MTESPGRRSLGSRLYSGETSLPIVAHAKWWYAASAILLVVAIGALVFRGLHLGIEFTGGAELTARIEQTTDSMVGDVRDAVIATGIDDAAEPRVVVVDDESVRVQTGSLTPDETTTVRDAIAAELGIPSDEITAQVIGPSWGAQITRQALIGLSFFIVAVILATVGIYALIGFDVTPATVIGFLTILGYSLYDTVVIFDKVRENTKGITAQNQYTYAEAANLGLNQTLMRSINTVIIALLPIGSILFVGAGLLGAGTLKDLALALFVGVAIGTYSSIFIATPLLVDFKSREPTLAALARRVEARRAAKAPRGAEVTDGAVTAAAVAAPGRGVKVAETGERRQPQRQSRSKRRAR
jgi:preprotein translocase subunit SecF